MAVKEYLDTMGAKHIVDTVKALINDVKNTITGFAPANHNHDGAYQPVVEYVTDTELTAKDFADKPYVDKAVTDAVTSGTVDLSNYYTKTQTYNKEETNALIPTVPTNVSAFSNDSGYLTEHQSLAGLATETFVTEKIAAIPSTDLTGYYTKAEVDALIANIGDGTGGETPTDPEQPTNPIATSISGNTSLKLGFPRTYTVQDANNSVFTDVIGTFTLESADFDTSNTANIETAIKDNTIELFYENEDLLDYSVTIKWTDAAGKYSPCELEVALIDSF